MATHSVSDLDSRTVDRLLQIVMVLLAGVGTWLIFFGSPVQTAVGIVLFILSVVAFLVVVKQTFDDHPAW